MTNSREFILTTLKKILEKETQKALEEAKQNAFLKAKEVFTPIIQYGAISSEEFLDICEELNIQPASNGKQIPIASFNSERDPCSHGISAFGPRSAC
jgi:hypothetical protein